MPNGLRSFLRSRTRALHEAVDAQIGVFDSVPSYIQYATATFRFRHSIEALLQAGEEWRAQCLSPFLARDLNDLATVAEPPAACNLKDDESARLGALYVLEGASLGAHILLRRAVTLGLSESFGARHLRRQVSDPARWGRFVTLLGRAQDVDFEIAGRAAQNTFGLALAFYSERR